MKFVYDDFMQKWNQFNPNMDIIPLEEPKNSRSKVQCHCHICNGTYDSNYMNLTMAIKRNTKMKGCRICSGQLIVKGINDLATRRPDLLPFIVDKETAYSVGISSSTRTKIKVECPVCKYQRDVNLYDFVCYGVACPMCSDGISMPNKFIRNIISRLPIDNYHFEYSSTWTNGKIYDVYFELNNSKYVIEMDGEQHFRDAWYITHEECKANDDYKDYLATANNVQMIRINCHSTYFEDMMRQILDSQLAILFDLSKLDFQECYLKSQTSLLIDVCNYFKAHPDMSTKEIGITFHMKYTTIQRYLKKGTEIGLCQYSGKEVSKSNGKRILEGIRQNSLKAFDVYDMDGNVLFHYQLLSDCLRDFKEKFPDRKFSESGIEMSLKTHCPYNGLVFKYSNMSLEQLYQSDELLKPICEYYTSHPDMFIKEIAQVFGISEHRLVKYLMAGTTLKLCKYQRGRNETRRQEISASNLRNKDHIKVYNANNDLILSTVGYYEIERLLNPIIGITNKKLAVYFNRYGDEFHFKNYSFKRERAS